MIKGRANVKPFEGPDTPGLVLLRSDVGYDANARWCEGGSVEIEPSV